MFTEQKCLNHRLKLNENERNNYSSSAVSLPVFCLHLCVCVCVCACVRVCVQSVCGVSLISTRHQVSVVRSSARCPRTTAVRTRTTVTWDRMESVGSVGQCARTHTVTHKMLSCPSHHRAFAFSVHRCGLHGRPGPCVTPCVEME